MASVGKWEDKVSRLAAAVLLLHCLLWWLKAAELMSRVLWGLLSRQPCTEDPPMSTTRYQNTVGDPLFPCLERQSSAL